MTKEESTGISVERVYDYVKRSRRPDEYVVLVDRLWPRGIKKDLLDIDQHLPELGPSHALRKWFGHEEGKWEVFLEKYELELMSDESLKEKMNALQDVTKTQPLTLLYSARNQEYNQAIALKQFLLQ